jgi:hypothetical protein
MTVIYHIITLSNFFTGFRKIYIQCTFWLWSLTFFNKRMALEWPWRISMHRRTDADYENHVFRCAQYVVLAYVTIRTSMRFIGQCLVIWPGLFSFWPTVPVLVEATSTGTIGRIGWGREWCIGTGRLHTGLPTTQIPLSGANLWERNFNLWE